MPVSTNRPGSAIVLRRSKSGVVIDVEIDGVSQKYVQSVTVTDSVDGSLVTVAFLAHVRYEDEDNG